MLIHRWFVLRCILLSLQEYLQMPRESIRTLVMSAEKDAVKRFLRHMHQSWDQLHVETTQVCPPTMSRELQAMETMTSAFIHKFPRVTPDLFLDLSQFIPFMSVSDIMNFPTSLIINDSVMVITGSVLCDRLMAIRDHSAEMKSPQKQAFVKRLLQSSVVGDVPSWPPYFLNSILPLLPHLPVRHFQQLTSDQVKCLTVDPGKLVFSESIVLGVLACYLNPEVLRPFLLASPVPSALWQQLALCVSEGLISASGRVRENGVVRPLNASTLPPPALATLRGLLPQLGARFLLSLPSLQLLDLLTQPGLPSFSPAQVSVLEFTVMLFYAEQTLTVVFKPPPQTPVFCSLPVPSCGDIRGTYPSAWTAYQLSRMAADELGQCVEVIGLDSSLSPEQRRALWVKLRQAYRPVRGLRPEQVLGLGCVVTELGERELQDTNLTDLGVLANLGAQTEWNRRRSLFLVYYMASLGNLLCGLTLPNNFSCSLTDSMASLFLRDLALPCSEQQMVALTGRLSAPRAFGPVSTWGPEVFTEIGTIAAGLDDMVLSALVQEQMEGLIPEAISLIPPTKMAVVFSSVQLSWLNVEQAWAVTEDQWAELNSGQRHALGLAQYEGDHFELCSIVSWTKPSISCFLKPDRIYKNYFDVSVFGRLCYSVSLYSGIFIFLRNMTL
uniref:Stereocilin LRR domain-containing protein n=1 Tax=Esox lucius TaxID=8010 RepID=A0A3P8ZWY8_ESOLU